MITGEVERVHPALRQLPGLEHLALVQVRTPEGPVTAADALGAAPGDRVVLSRGSAAFGTKCPADAAVVCVLE